MPHAAPEISLAGTDFSGLYKADLGMEAAEISLEGGEGEASMMFYGIAACGLSDSVCQVSARLMDCHVVRMVCGRFGFLVHSSAFSIPCIQQLLPVRVAYCCK